MAKEALELAQGYEKLANDTMTASGKTQITQSKTDKEVEDLKTQQDDLKAKTKAKEKADHRSGLRTWIRRANGWRHPGPSHADACRE
jgi:hypothetical protein